MPGTREPPGMVAPGTTGPNNFVQAGYLSAWKPQASVSMRQYFAGLVGLRAIYLVVLRVVGERDQQVVGLRALRGLVIVCHCLRLVRQAAPSPARRDLVLTQQADHFRCSSVARLADRCDC